MNARQIPAYQADHQRSHAEHVASSRGVWHQTASGVDHDGTSDTGLPGQSADVTDLSSFYRYAAEGWNRFWFTPSDPATLSVIRIATGLLVLYSQLVWALNSDSFFGPTSWLNPAAVAHIQTGSWAWSLIWLVDDSPALLGLFHAVAVVVAITLMIGLFSRTSAALSFIILVSCANRNPAALYGFDQIITFLTLYLAVGPCGACFSTDCLFAAPRERTGKVPSIAANVAVRLMQLQLCLLYLIAGLSKLKGTTWWSGSAFWGAIGNLEYQTVDLTWLAEWPIVVNLLTHVAVFWEVSYCALVWHRLSRPLMLALAVAVHMGIGICFGMLTFGLSMVLANVAFVSPQVIRRVVSLLGEWSYTPNSADAAGAPRFNR